MRKKIFAVALLIVALMLSEPVMMFLLQRNVAFSLRGQVLLLIAQFFSLGLGALLLLGDRQVRLLGRCYDSKRMLFAFIALNIPFLIFGASEATLFVLADRFDAIRSISRLHNFEAFKTYNESAAIQGENTFWRRQGFHERNGLRFYPPISAPGFYINSDGLRTRELAQEGLGAFEVAVLGGSTVWGSNVTDAHTLPAYLENELKAQTGRNVRTYNLGVEGHSFRHELALLKAIHGKVAFRAAIFFHGGNDFIETAKEIQEQRVGPGNKAPRALRTLNEFETFLLFKGLALRLAEGLGLVSPPSYDDTSALQVIEGKVVAYRARLAEAQTFCKEQKMACFFFLQPLIFTRAGHSGFESAIMRNCQLNYPGAAKAYNMVVDRILEEKSSQVFDLRDGFNSTQEPVFGDIIHVNERGNETLARRMAELVASAVAAVR